MTFEIVAEGQSTFNDLVTAMQLKLDRHEGAIRAQKEAHRRTPYECKQNSCDLFFFSASLPRSVPILVGFLCDVKFAYRQTFVAGTLYFGTICKNKTLAIFSQSLFFTVGLWLVGASRRELAGVTDVFRIRRTVAGCKKRLYTHTASWPHEFADRLWSRLLATYRQVVFQTNPFFC